MDQQIPETLPSIEAPGADNPNVQPNEIVQFAESHQENASAQRIEQGISTPLNPVAVNVPDQSQQVAPQVMSPHVAPPAGVTGFVPTPHIADDTDLIEKEWVEKAKEIVNKTKHDPYLQNQEMTKVKADYLKKRYNKELKLEHE